MSIFDKMKKDTRLRSNLKAAKEASPDDGQISNKDFPGVDGEYIFRWTGYNDFEGKDGTAYVEFIFTATDANDEHVVGKKCNIFLAFKDSGNLTMEAVQERFMTTLQQLGIQTPSLSPEEIERAIKSYVGKMVVKAAVVTSKNGDYRNLFLRTLLDETAEAPPLNTAVEEPAKPAKKAPAKKSPPPAKEPEPEEDEWEEVEESEEAEWSPSVSVGYECVYEGETFTVTAGDDSAMTVELENEAGEGYSEVPFDDVEWVEEE